MAKTFNGPDKITIVHSADWHVCDEFLEDAQNCLDFLVDRTREIQPDLIVISGDIYNHRQIRQESAAARLAFLSVRQLAGIAPVIVLIGTPSHDGQGNDQETERGRRVAVDHLAPGLAALQWAFRPGGSRARVLRNHNLTVAPRPVGAAKTRVSQAYPGAQHDDDKTEQDGAFRQ